jgi:hypothetical protein
MKRAVMRCRANYSGQAWPEPSDRCGVATRFIAEIFSNTDLIPRHHDSSLEAARPIQSARHAHHFWPLEIPSKIESAIDTHRYRHTPTV